MKEYNKHIVELYISDVLDTLGFYIGNPDGERSEKDLLKVEEEIYDALQEDKPEIPFVYIKQWLQKNYPFNI